MKLNIIISLLLIGSVNLSIGDDKSYTTNNISYSGYTMSIVITVIVLLCMMMCWGLIYIILLSLTCGNCTCNDDYLCKCKWC